MPATASAALQIPAAGTYRLDPAASAVSFATRHMFGLGAVTGTQSPSAMASTPGTTRRYQASEHAGMRGMLRISRADVADFLITQVTDPAWIGKTMILR